MQRRSLKTSVFSVYILCLALALVGQWAPPSHAQQAESQQTGESSSQEPAVEPIPVADIARSANEVDNQMRGFEALLEVDPLVSEIQTDLPTLVQSLQKLRDDPESGIPEELSSRALDNIGKKWLKYKKTLNDWQEHLMQRSGELRAIRNQLTAQKDIWLQTHILAREEQAPIALLERITSVMARLREVEVALRVRTDVVLTLQKQVSDELTDIDELLDRIEAAQEEKRAHLFVRDSAPLWRALLSPPEEADIAGQFEQVWRNNLEAIGNFWDLYTEEISIHAIFVLILLCFLVFLRARSRTWNWDEDEDQDQDNDLLRRVLDHPVATGSLLALLSMVWVYPLAPILIFEIAELLLVLPLLVLLPGIFPPNIRRVVYILSIPFVLGILTRLTGHQNLIQRLAQFLLTGVSLAVLLYVIRHRMWSEPQKEIKSWRAAMLLVRTGAILLIGSLVSNMIGNVSLADLLTRSTLGGIYLAITLFAIYSFLNGIILIATRTPFAQSLNMVRRRGDVLIQRTRTLIYLAAVFVWFWLVLEGFGLWQPLRASLTILMGRKFVIGTVEFSLSAILSFVLAIWLAVILSRFIRFVLEGDVLPRFKLQRGVPMAISSLVHYIIIGFGIVLALAAAGIELSQFALIAGALGVGIGFGLQNLVNNFVSGLILIFERPIQTGDTIQLADLIGKVRRIGIRSSTVKTFDGAEVIIPNGNLISDQVINWTLSDRHRRVELPVGVAYGTDPKQVLKILREIAEKHEDVLDVPEPTAFFKGFGQSSLDFCVRFWMTDFENWVSISSEVAVALNDALKEANISIPFPQRDLHVRSISEPAKRSLASNRRNRKASK